MMVSAIATMSASTSPFALPPNSAGRDFVASRWIGPTSSSGTHQFSFDRNWIAEEVKNGAVSVNRRGQFLIASGVLWPA